MDDISQVLKIVCDFFNKNDMKYVVVGGIAVMYHGVPRTTVDIDFIIDLNDEEITQFVSFMQSENFEVALDDALDSMREKTHIIVFVGDGLLRLDLQGVISDFDRKTLNRSIFVSHLGTSLNLGSVEDTLINKILFQGEQDLRYALGIITRNREMLDFEYVEEMCMKLGIHKEWKIFKDTHSGVY
ncbi:MAG: hypothetical protein P1Q69_07855 [Candidatus Thorarchaeota archaeon]|nr:hypothetical protein [Candidatus Thorarchaeota archaeon]